MSLQASFVSEYSTFSFDARTSRGSMKEKASWFIRIWDNESPEINGVGECGPLPGLSPDHTPELNEILEGFISRFNNHVT